MHTFPEKNSMLIYGLRALSKINATPGGDKRDVAVCQIEGKIEGKEIRPGYKITGLANQVFITGLASQAFMKKK